MRLRRCFLWNEIKRLSFLAEVGESQCRGRLLLLVVPHAGDDEDDDRDHIGKDLIELGGDKGNGQPEVEVIRAPNRTEPQMAVRGRHMQKMTNATASQPTPERPSWFHTQPAMVVI